MVDHPGGYRWSSYAARMEGVGHDWLDIDLMYEASAICCWVKPRSLLNAAKRSG